MPAFPTESELFPTGDLAPATAKAKFLQWLQASTGLLGSSGNAADARAALGFKRGANIASAATINLTAATGDLVDVTGATTITAITLADGEERTVRFTGVLTLTNGASLVLPGGANITTAAGDFAVFRGYASGVVRCVSYMPVAGLVALSGNQTIAGTKTFSTSPVVPTPATTDDSTKVATTAYVRDLAIGVDQTWQDVKASRAFGATYTNSTGKGLDVHVTATSTVQTSVTLTVGGRPLSGTFQSQVGGISAITVTVPNGATYSASMASGTLVAWEEMR